MSWFSRLFGRKEEAKAVVVAPEVMPSVRARQDWNISLEAVGWARAGKDDPRDVNPFAPAKPPPGTLPKGDAALAMDEVPGISGWAYGELETAYGAVADMYWPGFTALALLAQKPEHRAIVGTLAREMTREWIKIQATGDGKEEQVKALEAEFVRLGVQDIVRQVIEVDGFQGRGHVFLDFGQVEGPELTHDIGDGSADNAASNAKVAKGKLVGLRVVEAMWVYPTRYNTTNPLAADWYCPQAWYIQGREVHRSRLLTMVSREVPDLLKPAYMFGGLSMTQIAQPYVARWERTVRNVNDLVHKYSVSGVKTNLATLLSNPAELMKRMAFFNAARDNQGMLALDKDTEDYFNVTTPLGTLDKLQAQSQEQMASICGIPIVKLLGITPSGLNASSEGEIAVFDDTISSGQEAHVRPVLDVIFHMAQRNLWGTVDPELTYTFNPLRQMTQKEMAEIEKLKADTGSVYIENGIIAPQEERDRVASDALSPYAGLDKNALPDLSEEEADGLGEIHEPENVEPPPKHALDAMFPRFAYDAWAEGDHPRDGNGKFSGTTHVVSMTAEGSQGAKVHSVHASAEGAEMARGNELKRSYAGLKGARSTYPGHDIAEKQLRAATLPVPRIDQVRIAGTNGERPQQVSLIHEAKLANNDRDGDEHLAYYGGQVDHSRAMKTADVISRAHWEAGHGERSDDLDADQVEGDLLPYPGRRQANAFMQDYFDRDSMMAMGGRSGLVNAKKYALLD